MPEHLAISPSITTGIAAENAANKEQDEISQPVLIQCKLSIGEPGDPLEAEADSMADRVMRMPGENYIQRKCSCNEEEEKIQQKPLTPFIQRKENSKQSVVSDAVTNHINSSKGDGSGLDAGIKSFMENRFGTDFGDVKIHADSEAAQLSRTVSAKAFTVGNDIYFNEGQYKPQSSEGRHLLAHELTHTLQQSSSGSVQPKLIQRALAPVVITSIADEIREATKGWGTDEERIFMNLQKLDRDPANIQTLMTTYQSRYHESLEALLRDEMSGSELRLALEEININDDPRRGNMIAATAPTNAAEYRFAAQRLQNAMEGLGTDEETIYSVLIPFKRDPVKLLELKKTYLSLTGSALIADIRDEMSGTELDYALFLLNTTADIDETADAMRGMVGSTAGWVPSGPGSGNTFATWASAPAEAAIPPLNAATSINCWEMVLYAAYNAAAINWNWIHNLYVNVPVNSWVSTMTSSLSRYSPGDRLQRGQLVFFDGLAHVALATGNGDEVYTFWPPPNTPFHPLAPAVATIDKVKTSTISALSNYMTTHGMGTPVMQVGDPSWWASH